MSAADAMLVLATGRAGLESGISLRADNPDVCS